MMNKYRLMTHNRLFYLIFCGFSLAIFACASPERETHNRTPLHFGHGSDADNPDSRETVSLNAEHPDDSETGTGRADNDGSGAKSRQTQMAQDANRSAGALLSGAEDASLKSNAPDDEDCRHFCATDKIRIEDPVRVASYLPEQLGIIALCGESARNPRCIDNALRNGAIILHSDEDGARKYLLYPTRFESFLDETRARIDMPAMEGRWSSSLGRIIPGVDGRRVSDEKTLNHLRHAIQSGVNSFEIAIEAQAAYSSDLQTFAGFEPTTLIGTFQTKFSRSKNRTHNVRLAASAVDGLLLMPGAEFSYNDWVGERSESRGFREAPVIEQGQLVEGLGGGACQVSSTIHAAALLSGLEIVERYNHSLPSSYIPMGMDAVVSYPILDLRIKNNFNRPVVLRVFIEDTTLIAQFYSDFERDSKVYFRHEIAAEIPYKETITVDPSLPAETIKITRRGKPGYRILRSRITLKDGKESFEKLYDDTYQPQLQRVSVAPGVIYPPPEAPMPPDA